MKASQPHSGRAGRFDHRRVGTELVKTFLPAPLPPKPPLDVSNLLRPLERANQALGRLDGVTSILPDPSLLIYMYVRKEALLSSQIEGTQSSLSELLEFEAAESPGAPLQDVGEVSNYAAAMDHGLSRLQGGFPLCLRLLCEIHAVLLRAGRGQEKNPGEFRSSQNWIGGSRPGNAAFVPPPPDQVVDCMGQLETFIHDIDDGLPTLIRAGLAHVQFESIHPFLDGNGRLGRLLITLMLCEQGMLQSPMLYLSLFLKKQRSSYYGLLQTVRERGNWEEWLEFFLDGVTETSNQAAETARKLIGLFDTDRKKIEALGRPASSALRVHQHLQQRPLLTIPQAVRLLGLSQPTVGKSVQHLVSLGIVRETSGRQRGRSFVYDAYLRLLDEGTEPLTN
jgi:Fic family protein